MSGNATPIIEFENARFSYDGEHTALADMTLTIEEGSFTCVLGGNGSGKSTLAKHVNALLMPDEGRVRVLGLDTSEPENTLAVRSGAGMVFQNPDDQIVASIIENDVAFGPENLGVAPDELRRRVDSTLARVGLKGFEKKQTETLSGGQKQRVAVAGVLAMQPQIIVFDEASAMLDPRGRAGLMRVCRELNDDGLTIVLITHFMEEAALADRVIVLDGGRVVLDGNPDDVFEQADRLSELALDVPFATRLSMALRARAVPVSVNTSGVSLENELIALLASDPSSRSGSPHEEGACAVAADIAKPSPPAMDDADVAGKPVIEFEGVSFTYDALSPERRRRASKTRGGKQAKWGRSPDEYWACENLTFTVREGEFFGIAGHTGSGKSTLIQLANGLLTPTAGTVKVAGTPITGKKAAAAARRDIGVVFQYPEHQLFAATVFDDVAFGPRNLGFSSEEVERSVRDAMAMVHLDFDELRERSPFALSGGQQRRVAFAGVLAMRPRTLVLDEPVAGLDPRARKRFLDLLAELHDVHGLTIVFVSHNMDDLARMCDRMLVLNEGRVFALDAPTRVFADEERLKSVGLGVPHGAHLANQLSRAGVELPLTATPSIDELADAIAARLARGRGGRP